MTIQLMQGQFTAHEAIDIITKIVHVKIKFHKDKIHVNANEEDIKMREKRIKQLQKELFEVRNFIEAKKAKIEMNSSMEIH
ncbi:MAG: hypothetical protein LH473_01055 [Chitinophagales bacterium]|nr:hypothetical protein [Chitinophagales bacterium]